MTIKVLAATPKERGKLLARLVEELLDELGYDDFRSRIGASGLDLEVKAKNRATLAPIFCKAKALPRETGPDELKKFVAAYQREKKRDKRVVGLFLALSGLSSQAREWTAKHGERGKGDCHIFGIEKVHALLRRARLISPPDVADSAIRSRLYVDLGPRFNAYLNGRFYWVQLVLSGRKPVAYGVLDAHGEPAPKTIGREVKRLDSTLGGKRLLDLQLRERIILALLDMVPRNLEAIAKEVRDATPDLREVLQDLVRENILVATTVAQPRWKHDRYSLRLDPALFLALARLFLEGPHRFRFLGSAFAVRLLHSEVPAHLEGRLKVRGVDVQRTGLWRMLTTSPAALAHALFAPTDRYFETDGKAAHGERAKAPNLARLYLDLFLRLAGDMEAPAFAELLGGKGVKAYMLRGAAKAAGVQEPFFAIEAESYSPLGRGAALIAGRTPHVGSAADAEQLVEYGTALMHMGEYAAAVVQFERGIKDLKDPSRLATAWNHRGFCMLELRKWNDAITCFNEALRFTPNSKQAWFHKAVCLKEVGDLSGAARCCRRALEIDPAYAEAKDLMQRL